MKGYWFSAEISCMQGSAVTQLSQEDGVYVDGRETTHTTSMLHSANTPYMGMALVVEHVRPWRRVELSKMCI